MLQVVLTNDGKDDRGEEYVWFFGTPTSAARAMHRETNFPEAWSRVVIMPNLQAPTKLSSPFILSCAVTAVSLSARVYGSAGLPAVWVLEKVVAIIVYMESVTVCHCLSIALPWIPVGVDLG